MHLRILRSSKVREPRCREEWFSNVSIHSNHPEVWLKRRLLGSTPRVPN